MVRVREITLMLLTAGIILFAGQNLRPVAVEFLFWNFQVPLALITLVPLLAGLVIGIAGTAITLGRRRRAAEPEPEAEDEIESPADGEVEYEPDEDDEPPAEV
ncbi:MAG: LapA family protein [Gemmatimonadota bacterium]|nr:MAG: LapA family protein [Gemmatimonadota bacterium]